jgi:2-hydroxychromene-2-carboxylate isomerase
MLKSCVRYPKSPFLAGIFLIVAAAFPAPQGTLLAAGDSPSAKGVGNEGNTLPSGIDIGKLDEFERKVFFRVANSESSVCGKGHSLLVSAKSDPTCRKSFYALRYVAKLVDSGYTDSEITEKLERRYRLGKQTIDVSTAPSKGNPGARVSIIEFVDYECPHCRLAQELLRQAMEANPNEVKVYFKHYPLSSHTNARIAAEAATAAHKQGKFWAYNDKVWALSDMLSPAALDKIAKEVGLDMAKYRSDKDGDEIKKRVQKDRDDGQAIGIHSTPTIFLNGRKYADHLEFANLKDWIDEELGR